MATTTVSAPINITRVNSLLYVGQDAFDTIQQAVNYAQANGGVGQVVILQGYAGSEAISSIVNGGANIYISDHRTPPTQNYVWSGSQYVPAGAAAAYFAANGTSGVPVGNVALDTTNQGTWGAGRIIARGIPSSNPHIPILQFVGLSEDGQTAWEYLRLTNDGNNYDAVFSADIIAKPYGTGAHGNITAEGILSGASLTLNGTPFDLTTLAYVNASNTFVDPQTFESTVTLSADPTTALEAATKQYVDDAIAGTGAFTYPPAGVTVSTGSAWGTSIPTANLAYVNQANTFTADQTINGAMTAEYIECFTSGANSRMYVGQNYATNNAVYYGFDFVGSGSLSNKGSIGIAGGNEVATFDPYANWTFGGNVTVSGNATFGTPYPLFVGSWATGNPRPSVTATPNDVTINPSGGGVVWVNRDAGTGMRWCDGSGSGAQVASVDQSGNASFNGNVTATGSATGNTVVSTSALFVGKHAYTLNALNTPQFLGIGYVNGLLIVRDQTSGGCAMFLCDYNTSVQTIGSNNVSGLGVSWSESVNDWQLVLTGGAIPRLLWWTFIGCLG